MRVCCWPDYKRPSSVSNKQSHVASFAAMVSGMYSASVNKRIMVGFLFEHQLTSPPFTMKMKLDVNFRLFLSPAQSESEYPSIGSLFSPP